MLSVVKGDLFAFGDVPGREKTQPRQVRIQAVDPNVVNSLKFRKTFHYDFICREISTFYESIAKVGRYINLSFISIRGLKHFKNELKSYVTFSDMYL